MHNLADHLGGFDKDFKNNLLDNIVVDGNSHQVVTECIEVFGYQPKNVDKNNILN